MGTDNEQLTIVLTGCLHGELDQTLSLIEDMESKQGIKVDLIICAGDFEAIRNPQDLTTMAVPLKYRHMHDFYQYYNQTKTCNIPMVFVLGNHESMGYMSEIPLGGWVAPNIYYMGYAGVVQFGGIRIAGLSGIYKPRDYHKGHFESVPYTQDTMRSAYHTRFADVFRLLQVRNPVDILITHDWPDGVLNSHNQHKIIQSKGRKAGNDILREVQQGSFGSPAGMEVMRKLRPKYHVSAHMHCRLTALVQHEPRAGVGDDQCDGPGQVDVTRFIALDKCLPRRQFLQVIRVPVGESNARDTPRVLCYDAEWLAIMQATHEVMQPVARLPPRVYEEAEKVINSDLHQNRIKQHEKWLRDHDYVIPSEDFVQTAQGGTNVPKSLVHRACHNPQTSGVCAWLQIPNWWGEDAGPTRVFLNDKQYDKQHGKQQAGDGGGGQSYTGGLNSQTTLNEPRGGSVGGGDNQPEGDGGSTLGGDSVCDHYNDAYDNPEEIEIEGVDDDEEDV